ncbi:hypothetical protein [Algibacter sp. 2305UL17-15]
MRLYDIPLGLVLTSPEGMQHSKDGSIPSDKETTNKDPERVL